MRVCPQCLESFDRLKGRCNRYCSAACYRAANAYVPSFTPVQALCKQANCGKPFTQTHWKQLYCCDECYRIRRRAIEAERPPRDRKETSRRARIEKILKKHGIAS